MCVHTGLAGLTGLTKLTSDRVSTRTVVTYFVSTPLTYWYKVPHVGFGPVRFCSISFLDSRSLLYRFSHLGTHSRMTLLCSVGT